MHMTIGHYGGRLSDHRHHDRHRRHPTVVICAVISSSFQHMSEHSYHSYPNPFDTHVVRRRLKSKMGARHGWNRSLHLEHSDLHGYQSEAPGLGTGAPAGIRLRIVDSS